MAYCQRCGEYCQDHYTYCKRCYFELGQHLDVMHATIHKDRTSDARLFNCRVVHRKFSTGINTQQNLYNFVIT